MKGKNIIRLTAAVILVCTMMLSLSSCIIDFGIYGDILDLLPDYNNQGNGGGNGDGDQDNGGYVPVPDGSGDIESDNYGDFFEGSGEGNTDGVSAVSKTLLSTVSIICDFGGSASAGSGVIYKVDKEKGDAYIITNYHVVYMSGYGRADVIKLYLYGMHLEPYAVKAILIGGSVTYDIAVLKVSGSEVIKNSYATAASIGDSEGVRVFDRVFAVGNSEGMGMSATEGIVSVESESLDLAGADGSLVSLRVMRVDAAVNHGNSGGGLFDQQGRLVGIVVAKDVSSDVDNMGYAIPVNLAVRVAENILDHCDGFANTKVKKALMGITITAYVSGLEMTPEGDEFYEINLVEVVEISGGSLAEGKAQVGDTINSITVDGTTHNVWRVHHVTDAMLEARAGSTVVLNVNRGGEKIDITFTIPESSFSSVN